jgi:acetylornithine deacetylase
MKTNTTEITVLLQALIRTPSFSKEEDKTATLIKSFLEQREIPYNRKHNNIWVYNKAYDKNKPTILLNSHHDTVNPGSGWKYDPYGAVIEDGKLIGLGSNDAGASLVSLIAVFLNHYHDDNLPYNIVLAATGEEEISGKEGIESIFDELGPVDFAIVGEPTNLQLAIAEKGLLVLDCHYEGIAGHAGRGEGENAIYKAISDLTWFRDFKFEKISPTLGPIQTSATQINAGTSHNVTPDSCNLVVDIRANDQYSLRELVTIVEKNTNGVITPRSLRLNPSSISDGHSILKAAEDLGIPMFGSPTLSDQALMPWPSVKIGPGESRRSHTADEFIYLQEIDAAIKLYTSLLKELDNEKLKNTESNETVG